MILAGRLWRKTCTIPSDLTGEGTSPTVQMFSIAGRAEGKGLRNGRKVFHIVRLSDSYIGVTCPLRQDLVRWLDDPLRNDIGIREAAYCIRMETLFNIYPTRPGKAVNLSS